MGKRRRARELALQFLYQWDFYGPADSEPATAFWENRRDGAEVKKFAESIIDGVRSRREQIDREIETLSQHWKLSRMSRIDRNILRIAVFELTCCPEIPPKVSIDEAIEIAKKFGAGDSGAFINGILDQVSRRAGRLDPEKDAPHEHDRPGDRNSE